MVSLRTDVSNALNEQNLDAAPGKFGENDNQSFQYVITYKGRLQSPEEFGNIIIKSTGQGQYLRTERYSKNRAWDHKLIPGLRPPTENNL